MSIQPHKQLGHITQRHPVNPRLRYGLPAPIKRPLIPTAQPKLARVVIEDITDPKEYIMSSDSCSIYSEISPSAKVNHTNE